MLRVAVDTILAGDGYVVILAPTRDLIRQHVTYFTDRLEGTGLGAVSSPPPDGQPVTAATPGLASPQILLGASATAFVDPSAITYSGLAPALVGVWQINLTIPSTAPTGGSVPIRVFLNSIPNVDPNESGSTTTTIAIK